MCGCAHGRPHGACERQGARGLGSGGAGPEGSVEAGPGVNWWRQLWAALLACDPPWVGSPGGPGAWVPCLGVQGGCVLPRGCRVEHGVG